MSSDFHDSLGPLVPHPTARCEETMDEIDWVGERLGEVVLMPCDTPLKYYANTRPPRALHCPSCGHESYEVPLGGAA